MDYKDYKNKLITYLNSGIRYPEDLDDDTIEGFFEFIDELEIKAESDQRYYELISDAYAAMRDYKKAYEAFYRFHNPKNPKHLKKLHSYEGLKRQPIIRPSKRVKALPVFPYADKEVLYNMFISNQDYGCCICGNEETALYTGIAYKNENKEAIYFNDEKEKFCAECLKSGKAAEQFQIRFNSPLIHMLTAIDEEKRDLITKNTPTCSTDFEQFHEDIWVTCCGDFCCYKKKESGVFHFQCSHCGKEIKMVEDS